MKARPSASPLASERPGTPFLLFDDACGLCTASIRFVQQHATGIRREAPQLHCAALQGAVGERLRAARPELATIDSIVWVTGTHVDNSTILVRSDAVLAALRYMGGAWKILAFSASLLPRRLRDAVYDMFARRRLTLGKRFGLSPAHTPAAQTSPPHAPRVDGQDIA